MTDEEKRARKIEREIAASSRMALRAGELSDDAPPLSPDERKARGRENARLRSAKYRARNPERSRAAVKKWRDKNHLEYQRAYRARKKAEKLEAARELTRAYKKAWRRANLERELARGREESKRFRANNPESVRASQRKWNAANMEYKRQHDRDRYAANPEKFKAKRRSP
ncbi:MAG: hypothetical protein ABL879_15815 [Devosia sp.]